MSTEIEQDKPSTIIKIIGIGSDGICFIETLIKSGLSGPEVSTRRTHLQIDALDREDRVPVKMMVDTIDGNPEAKPA